VSASFPTSSASDPQVIGAVLTSVARKLEETVRARRKMFLIGMIFAGAFLALCSVSPIGDLTHGRKVDSGGLVVLAMGLVPVVIVGAKLVPVLSPASAPIVVAFREKADRITLVEMSNERLGKSQRYLYTLHVTFDGQRLSLKLWNMFDAQAGELAKSLRNALPQAWEANVPKIQPGPVA
jgi:hypothetical protein